MSPCECTSVTQKSALWPRVRVLLGEIETAEDASLPERTVDLGHRAARLAEIDDELLEERRAEGGSTARPESPPAVEPRSGRARESHARARPALAGRGARGTRRPRSPRGSASSRCTPSSLLAGRRTCAPRPPRRRRTRLRPRSGRLRSGTSDTPTRTVPRRGRRRSRPARRRSACAPRAAAARRRPGRRRNESARRGRRARSDRRRRRRARPLRGRAAAISSACVSIVPRKPGTSK